MKKIIHNPRANKVMSLDQIRKEAEANYHGDAYDANFTGIETVDAATLRNLQIEAKPYRISITNANASAKTIQILPGLVYDANGTLANGQLRTAATAYASTDGTDSVFTSSSSNGTIEKFINFIRHNPSRLVGIKVASTVASQITDGVITVSTDSVFKSQEAEEQIYLANYTDENRNQDKEVTARVVLNLDNQKVMKILVAGSSTLTLTFFIGKITNIAAAAAKG